jgi:hypothetical protein
MSEAEIAAHLAEKVIPSSATIGESKKEEAPESGDFHNNDPLETTLQTYQLLEYFDVPIGMRHSAEVQQQINSVLAWARQENPGADFTTVLEFIQTSEGQFGNTLKEQRLIKLATHVKIQSQIKMLQLKERQLYG